MTPDQLASLMKQIGVELRKELPASVNRQGDMLVGAMKPAVARGTDGRNELVESVRKEAGANPLQVKVMAGGALTTRQVRAGANATYDYALANEFGTKEMTAQPFFWPTYRLLKKRIRASINRDAKKIMEKVVKLS